MAEPPGAPGTDPGVSAAESIAVLRDSESCRLLQPVRFGGRAASRSASVVSGFIAAVADLAERDGSGGWFAAAVNTSAYRGCRAWAMLLPNAYGAPTPAPSSPPARSRRDC